MSDDEERPPAPHNLRVLRGRRGRQAPKSQEERPEPDRYYTTTQIRGLAPIAPGWAVYVLFAHAPEQEAAIGPRVVRRYDVAAWGDVLQSDVAVYGGEERPAGSHQYWEPLISSGTLFMYDGCHLSEASALVHYGWHFVTMSLVGPTDPVPPWVGDSAEAAAAREAIIAEVYRDDGEVPPER